MASGEDGSARRVAPRKWAMATLAGLAAMQAGVLPVVTASPAMAEQAGEGGESGEAGVERSQGPSAFLTQLGYFEGTYRIAASLYLGGHRDAARAHLEESHHAFYEDIEAVLTQYGAPDFNAAAEAFLTAIADDMAGAEVEARLDALLAALVRTGAAAGASNYDQVLSLRELVMLAAAEYEGGVDDGRVEAAIEYRDSWGFLETAKTRARALAEGDDAGLAEAGREVLERLSGSEALYPGLMATEASKDPGLLTLAAGWIEIIALRQR